MDNYAFVSELGQGTFGDVALYEQKDTKEMVVIKTIRKTERSCKYVMNEIMIHSSINHPNIIAFKDIIAEDDDVLHIVMEYADSGDLFNLVFELDINDIDVIKGLFKQIICALDYCHSKNIYHRDIKLENILISGNTVKLCDFGFSLQAADKQASTLVGSAAYIAPEMIQSKSYDAGKADIWACGVLLYALIYRKYPFRGKSDKDTKGILESVKRGVFKFPEIPQISYACKHMISCMLQSNPEDRCTLDMIKQSRWLSEGYDYDYDDLQVNNLGMKETITKTKSDIYKIVNTWLAGGTDGDAKDSVGAFDDGYDDDFGDWLG